VAFRADVLKSDLNDTFDNDVIQDPITGDLRVSDEDGEVIVKAPVAGSRRIITYRIAQVDDEGGLCDLGVKGTARLDTLTNTITIPIRFKELGCKQRTSRGAVDRHESELTSGRMTG
jgi:hypothetical protein